MIYVFSSIGVFLVWMFCSKVIDLMINIYDKIDTVARHSTTLVGKTDFCLDELIKINEKLGEKKIQ